MGHKRFWSTLQYNVTTFIKDIKNIFFFKYKHNKKDINNIFLYERELLCQSHL